MPYPGRRLGGRGGAAASCRSSTRASGSISSSRTARAARAARSARTAVAKARAGRLHADAHGLDPHHHAVPQHEDSLRRREGLRAGVADRVGPAARARPRERAGERRSKEFFELVRAAPDKYTVRARRASARPDIWRSNCSSATPGVDTLVIAYKGAGPMLNDIMGGQIQLIADPMASSLPLAAAGKIKALAVTSTKRVAAAPDYSDHRGVRHDGLRLRRRGTGWGPKGLPRRHHGEAAGRSRQGRWRCRT